MEIFLYCRVSNCRGGISVTITGRRLDGMGNFIELEFDCDNSSLCHMEAENRLTKVKHV